jgi:hypothetical protein
MSNDNCALLAKGIGRIEHLPLASSIIMRMSAVTTAFRHVERPLLAVLTHSAPIRRHPGLMVKPDPLLTVANDRYRGCGSDSVGAITTADEETG